MHNPLFAVTEHRFNFYIGALVALSMAGDPGLQDMPKKWAIIPDISADLLDPPFSLRVCCFVIANSHRGETKNGNRRRRGRSAIASARNRYFGSGGLFRG
jgi:hypothetical protein